jgi:hypothetical protein
LAVDYDRIQAATTIPELEALAGDLAADPSEEARWAAEQVVHKLDEFRRAEVGARVRAETGLSVQLPDVR